MKYYEVNKNAVWARETGRSQKTERTKIQRINIKVWWAANEPNQITEIGEGGTYNVEASNGIIFVNIFDK